jgi:hypothetical protein
LASADEPDRPGPCGAAELGAGGCVVTGAVPRAPGQNCADVASRIAASTAVLCAVAIEDAIREGVVEAPARPDLADGQRSADFESAGCLLAVRWYPELHARIRLPAGRSPW